VLRIVSIVLAAVIALNVLFVAWLAFLSFLQGRRRPQEPANVRELPRAHALPPLMDRHASRRVVGAATLVAMLFAGTAFASPHAREVAASMLGSVARGLQIGPSEEATIATAPEGGASESLRTRGGPTRPAAPPRGSGGHTASSSSTINGSGSSGAPPVGHVPAIPTAVTASVTSSTSISIMWTDVAAETGYRIERSKDGATEWTPVGTTTIGVTSFGDTGLLQGATYFYRVVASNDVGESAPSDVASATTSVDPASPPTVLAVALSTSSINLTWADVASETGYRVERSADGVSGWLVLTTAGQDVTSYTDAGLQPGTTYYYRVFATNAGGDSASSDVVSAATGTDSPSPASEVFPPVP
jgi:Fibronectin type III domain